MRPHPLLLALALAPICPPASAQKAKPPNILFLFADDHAYQAISAYGSRINRTPNLDRLAAGGMLFRNCFVTNSICAPSRAVILTGKHSHLNGVVDNRAIFDGEQLTFPKLAQRAGYQTAMIGKWHLKSDPTGFDYWRVLPGQGRYYNPVFKSPAGKVTVPGYTTDIITDTALEWLKKRRDPAKPFVLMCQHKAPHRRWEPGPKHLRLYEGVTIPEPANLFDDYSGRASAAALQEMTIARHLTRADLKLVPPRDLDARQLSAWKAAYDPRNAAFEAAGLEGDALVHWKYQRYIKDYLRCIASVDDNIGRMLDYLDESGLAKNTVVVYSSDQGFYLGEHGWFDKRWMYEESLRTPLIVRWPGVVKAGSRAAQLVQNLDFAETFLEICGVQPPDEMQGRSLVPILRGESPPDWRRSIYYHYYEFPAVHSVRPHYGVRTDRYKLIRYYTLDEWELFDLEKDPHEMHSVYGDPAYARVQTELSAELRRLQVLYREEHPDAPRGGSNQRVLRRLAAKVTPHLILEIAEGRGGRPPEPDPVGKPITLGARVTPAGPDGVILAQGGEAYGYSLYLLGGIARFAVRTGGELYEVRAPTPLPLGEPHHLVGILDTRGGLHLRLDGVEVATAPGRLISRHPIEGISVGEDAGSQVGKKAPPLRGKITDLRLYWGVPPQDQLEAWARR